MSLWTAVHVGSVYEDLLGFPPKAGAPDAEEQARRAGESATARLPGLLAALAAGQDKLVLVLDAPGDGWRRELDGGHSEARSRWPRAAWVPLRDAAAPAALRLHTAERAVHVVEPQPYPDGVHLELGEDPAGGADRLSLAGLRGCARDVLASLAREWAPRERRAAARRVEAVARASYAYGDPDGQDGADSAMLDADEPAGRLRIVSSRSSLAGLACDAAGIEVVRSVRQEASGAWSWPAGDERTVAAALGYPPRLAVDRRALLSLRDSMIAAQPPGVDRVRAEEAFTQSVGGKPREAKVNGGKPRPPLVDELLERHGDALTVCLLATEATGQEQLKAAGCNAPQRALLTAAGAHDGAGIRRVLAVVGTRDDVPGVAAIFGGQEAGHGAGGARDPHPREEPRAVDDAGAGAVREHQGGAVVLGRDARDGAAPPCAAGHRGHDAGAAARDAGVTEAAIFGAGAPRQEAEHATTTDHAEPGRSGTGRAAAEIQGRAAQPLEEPRVLGTGEALDSPSDPPTGARGPAPHERDHGAGTPGGLPVLPGGGRSALPGTDPVLTAPVAPAAGAEQRAATCADCGVELGPNDVRAIRADEPPRCGHCWSAVRDTEPRPPSAATPSPTTTATPKEIATMATTAPQTRDHDPTRSDDEQPYDEPRGSGAIAVHDPQAAAMQPARERDAQHPVRQSRGGTEDLELALAKVWLELPPLKKGREALIEKGRTSFTYGFASLPDVDAMSAPTLKKHQVARTFTPTRGHVICRLFHVPSGQWKEGDLPMPPTDARLGVQAIGGALTYQMRRLVCAMLGIVLEDDDDGAIATAAAKMPPGLRDDARALAVEAGGRIELLARMKESRIGPDVQKAALALFDEVAAEASAAQGARR